MTDTPLPTNNDDQLKLWNGVAGQAWVDEQALLDALFRPFEEALAAAARAASARRVLDVGCGTGATTLAIARAIDDAGPGGRCTGIDLSEPMTTLARERARRDAVANAEFLCADAQARAFEPATFDRVVSRFGVMFFADPVAAFANLRRAATDDAALHCIVWRSAAENPFMTTAERAVAPLLPSMPARRRDGPGQFAFAEPPRVQDLLGAGGWRDVALQPLDVPCALEPAQLDRYLSRLGPVGVALAEADDATRDHLLQVLRTAFAPFRHGDQTRFTAACWSVTARAGAIGTARA